MGELYGCVRMELERCLDSMEDYKTKAPNVKWRHRETLAARNITLELNVMDIIIKVVNYIKTRPVKPRFFQKNCLPSISLIYYCNSRWLSRGNVLARVDVSFTFIYRQNHTMMRKTLLMQIL